MTTFWATRSGRLVRGALLAAPVAFVLLDNVADCAVVHGLTMQPTLNPGGERKRDIVLLNRMVTRSFDLHRGDVVALWAPDQERVAMIRRLVGMEGDVVLSRDNRWVLVPRGHAWIEGDNPTAPGKDSHVYGPVPLGLVFARVSVVLWPPSRIGRLPASPPEPRVRHES